MSKINYKIFLLILVILLLSLQEFGIININISKSTIKNDLEERIKANSQLITTENTLHNTGIKENYQQIPIVFLNKEDENLYENSENTIVVIQKKNIPISFLPFYHNIDFEIDNYINKGITRAKQDKKNVYLNKESIIGNIICKGNFNAFGIISNAEIRRLISTDCKNQVEKSLSKYLNSSEK